MLVAHYLAHSSSTQLAASFIKTLITIPSPRNHGNRSDDVTGGIPVQSKDSRLKHRWGENELESVCVVGGQLQRARNRKCGRKCILYYKEWAREEERDEPGGRWRGNQRERGVKEG